MNKSLLPTSLICNLLSLPYKEYLVILFIGFGGMTIASGQPSNNDCTGATFVPVVMGECSAEFTADISGATWSGVGSEESGCNNRDGNRDVWFSFIAPNSGVVRFNFISSTTNYLHDIYQGNCGSLQHLDCFAPNEILTDLLPGATYFLRLYAATSNATGTEVFCLKGLSNPDNDYCTAATPAAVGSGICGPILTACDYGASNSSVANPSCATTGNVNVEDVWYSFTAPTSGEVVLSFSGDPQVNPHYTLYDGNCNTPSEIACGELIEDPVSFNNLSSGNTYFVRLWANDPNGADFGMIDFCLEAAQLPANDLCSGAIAVTVGAGACGPAVTGNNFGATDSGVQPPACGNYTGGDIWYSFVAPASGNVQLNSSEPNGRFAIYGNTCGSLTALDCQSMSAVNYLAGLTGGSTYYIRIWKDDNIEAAFSFCLEEGPVTPSNDDCSSASPVLVGVGSCGPLMSATNLGATNSGVTDPSCYNYEGGDIWYSFTAPSTGSIEIIRTNASNSNYYASVYAGTCGSLTEIACGRPSNSINGLFVNALVAGDTYFIRWAYEENSSTAPLEFCVQEVDGVSNDICSVAESITIGSGTCGPQVNVDIEMAGNSGVPVPGCALDVHQDVWYTFTAPATGSVILDLVTRIGYSSGTIFTVYEGNCNSLTELACTRMTSTNQNRQFIGLSPSTNYYLRVVNPNVASSSATLIFCLEEGSAAPANDLCAGAETVTVGTSGCGATINGSTSGASASGETIPDCSEEDPRDLWYTFVAPGSGSVEIDLISESMRKPTFAVYEGNCGGLNLISCRSINTFTNASIQELTSGNTYYLRWWDEQESISANNFGTISFCMQEQTLTPPANDLCSGAIGVPVGSGSCGATENADNNLATNSMETAPACGTFDRGGDLWYSITAPASGNVYLDLINSGLTGLSVSVYEGSCGSLSEVYCGTNLNIGGTPEELFGLTPSNTYLIRWWTNSNESYGTFTFCLEEAPASPANDLCSNATPLSLGSGTCGPLVAGNNIYATASMEATPSCGFYYDQADIWYSFVAPASGGAIIELNSSYWVDLNAALYSGSCGSLTEEDCFSLDVVSNNPGEAQGILSGLTPGATYYLRFWDANTNSPGSIYFCVEEFPAAPANDLCSAATTVSLGTDICGTVVNDSNEGATNSGEPAPPCNEYNGGDLWYQFVAPTSGEIDIDFISSELDNAGIALYEGTCGGLSLIQCNTFSEGYAGNFSNLVSGNTYFVRIWDGSYDQVGEVSFCIKSVPAPPANDDCSNAVALTESGSSACENSVSGTTLGATSDQSPNCQGIYPREVYYTFSPVENANFTFVVSNESNPVYLEIATGSCGSLATQICTGNSSATLALQAGTTYTIMVAPQITNQATSFDLCVYRFVPSGSSLEGVGINVENPVEKLQVNGALLLGSTENDHPGTLRFHNGQFQGNNGNGWISLSGGASSGSDNLGNHTATLPLDMSGQPISDVALPSNPSDAATKQYVDDHTDADASTSNETITAATLNGTDLEITEAGAITTVDLSSLSGGSDNLGNHTATQDLDMASNKITNLTNPTAAQDGATKSYVDAHTDGDASSSNETITGATLNGTDLEITEAGATTTIDLSALSGGSDNLGNHTATQDLDMARNQISNLSDPIAAQDGATKSYVDAHTDADASTTNETITAAMLNGTDLEITEAGTTTTVDLSSLGGSSDNLGDHTATQDLDMASNKITSLTDPTAAQDGATKSYVDAHTDGDASANNETITAITLGTSNTLTITEAGTDQTVDLSALDNKWEFLTIDNELIYQGGNVGVGVSNPSVLFEVGGDMTVAGTNFQLDATNRRIDIGESSNPTFLDVDGGFSADNSTLFVDATNNRVGIGTSTPNQLFTVDGGDISFNISHLFVDWSNGNVGIGRTNPAYDLDVLGDGRYLGNLLIETNSNGSNPQIDLTETADDFARIKYNTTASTNHWTLAGKPDDTNADARFNLFFSGLGNVISFYGDGDATLSGNFEANRIGVGTDAPTDFIEVQGSGSTNLFRVRNGSSTKMRIFNNGSISLGSNNTNVTADDVYVANQMGLGVSAPTYRLHLPNSSTNSNGRALANAWQTYSDARVKGHRREMHYGLAEVLALRPLYYRHYSSEFDSDTLKILKDEYSEEIGFLAQEVNEVISEVVQQPQDESKELWSMDYEKLTPVLVKAIQELNDKVETLEAENDQLKTMLSEIAAIKMELATLKEQQAAQVKRK